MKIHHRTLSNNHAISEIVGSVILLLIAVLSFSAIYLYVFPLPGYVAESNVDIQGSVSGEYPELIHVGGETLQEYQIFIDGEPGETRYNWKMGEKKSLLDERNWSNYGRKIDVMVISKTEEEGSQIVFEGEFEFDNPFYNEPPTQDTPSFYSSLGQNTAGEDLICYKNGEDLDSEGESVTYIYTWYKKENINDEYISFADIYFPCNTNSSSFTKDYTNPKNNGLVENANWTKNGRVGGGYSFKGDGSIICDIPEPFTNLSKEFTITTWIQSSNTNEDYNCILEAFADNQNYVQIFQYNNSIYASISFNNDISILKSNPLMSNEWYHIGSTWDGTSLKLYVNGSESNSSGDASISSLGDEELFSIGQKTDGTFGWNGSIDEIYVYDIAVSEDHIYQQYLCTRTGSSNVSVIVSEETTSGETWNCYVTPNDSHQDGKTKNEDSIDIKE